MRIGISSAEEMHLGISPTSSKRPYRFWASSSRKQTVAPDSFGGQSGPADRLNTSLNTRIVATRGRGAATGAGEQHINTNHTLHVKIPDPHLVVIRPLDLINPIVIRPVEVAPSLSNDPEARFVQSWRSSTPTRKADHLPRERFGAFF
jgi:hypothetical protein